jgi:heme oxygenase (mycobilin-producing)
MSVPGVFRVALRMQIRPGQERAFENAWLSGANVITDQPANLGQWLFASSEETGVYHIVSDWVDEPSFREYELSDEHFVHRARLHPYRESGSMTTMTTVYAMTKEGADR